ncbi:hypothetical protein [Pseudobdellovibrio exovorus]|uniref:SCP domain-containing protein n=1 Tax=Pseudobdellovibrio exovorus JSS TaxID=1184267 RepID=M4VAP5_9BACT|nr:hypothetical protein [Pseudobdellovibrio exovorus]AGH95086.1 hypothetical protein A11Q_869 [Pseudobdellovibrio exovorus JSS]
MKIQHVLKSNFRIALIILSLIPNLVWATTASAACWQQENNPVTGKRYSSATEYQAHLNFWAGKMPIIPNPLNLVNGYNLYKSELPKMRGLSNDKVKHCYAGCRIAQETSQNTANYMGWYKERQDLIDCNPNTRFEHQDYIATAYGAKIKTNSSADCVHTCEQAWKSK